MSPVKPWMVRRPDESARQYHARLNRTCFACGTECASVAACDEHEKACPKIVKSGKKGTT